jgi:hypothetical protein
MKSLMCSLFFLIACCSAHGYMPDESYINRVAVDPHVNVFTNDDRTQITYTNGDPSNPEIFILICDTKSRRMELQYTIFRDGFQLTDIDYFTIQRYPKKWLKMTSPYYPPSTIVYDSGMVIAKNSLSNTIQDLLLEGDWGYVFSLEKITEGKGMRTKAWSEIIPARVFRRDLSDKDLTACNDLHSKVILPLLGL